MPRMKKVYGSSRKEYCVLCGQPATVKNAQGIPTCRHHIKEEVTLRCSCGSFLDVQEGRYGTFFLCLRCGPISFSKALNINDLPLQDVNQL